MLVIDLRMRLWAVTFCIFFTCFKKQRYFRKRLSYKIVHLFFDYFLYRDSRQCTWLSLKIKKKQNNKAVITLDLLFKFQIFSHVLSHPNPYYWVFCLMLLQKRSNDFLNGRHFKTYHHRVKTQKIKINQS